MDERTSQDEPRSTPESGPVPEPRDAATSAHDLAGAARANRDATWGDTADAASRLPVILTGEAGPKGRIAAQLRALSRHERASHGEIPRGTTTPGTGRYLIAGVLLVLLVLASALVLIFWAATR